MTTDGTIGELERRQYEEPEEKTIRELQSIGKPFVVLVNSKKPYGEEAKRISEEIEEKYGVKAMPVNCEQLKEDDIFKIIEAVLFEFPISEIQFFVPKWVEMLPRDHKIKTDLINRSRIMGQFQRSRYGKRVKDCGQSLYRACEGRNSRNGYRMCKSLHPD